MTQSQEAKNYFIVEFRLPYVIAGKTDPKDAYKEAATLFENEYNVYPSGWFARVFEYGPGDEVGCLNEYFFNPTGTVARKVDQNIEKHNEIYGGEEYNAG